jgi:hypothetical protein
MVLVFLVTGCRKTLDVYESKSPSPLVTSTNTNGAVLFSSRQAASDTLLITGNVQRVKLPLLNSPSVGGDKASCLLKVPASSIPEHPDVSRVNLHYDNHGWLQGLTPGTEVVLRFQRNGEFDGVYFSNFIQPAGKTN